LNGYYAYLEISIINYKYSERTIQYDRNLKRLHTITVHELKKEIHITDKRSI